VDLRSFSHSCRHLRVQFEVSVFSGAYRLGDVVITLKELLRHHARAGLSELSVRRSQHRRIIARKLVVERTGDFAYLALGLLLAASLAISSSFE
jgi:hypothetical protein